MLSPQAFPFGRATGRVGAVVMGGTVTLIAE